LASSSLYFGISFATFNTFLKDFLIEVYEIYDEDK